MHHVQNISLAIGNKERLGKCVMAMERASVAGAIVGAGVAWAFVDLIMVCMTEMFVTLLAMAVLLALWKRWYGMYIMDKELEVVEDEDGVLTIA